MCLAAAVLCMRTGELRVMASSADISFTADSETVRVGDYVTVTMTVTASVVPGELEGYVSYDSDLFEYVSGPDVMAGGEGLLKIYDVPQNADTLVNRYTMYFKALKMGSGEFAMRGTPEIYEYEQGYLMSVSSGRITVTVEAKKTASSDASLEIIRVSPGNLEPQFATDIHEYNVTVRNDVNELYVSAITTDTKATLKIEGNTGLNVGQNRVLVIVTAEDGTKDKYVIYVARENAPEEETDGGETAGETLPENGNEGDPASAQDSNGDIPETKESEGTSDSNDGAVADNEAEGTANSADNSAKNGQSFYCVEENDGLKLYYGGRYTLYDDPGSVRVPDEYGAAEIVISGYRVTAYAPRNKADGDYLLLVLAPEGGKPGLYCYDRVEKTLQRYGIYGSSEVGTAAESTASAKAIAGYEKSIKTLTLTVGILCGALMLMLILLIRALIRKSAAERRFADTGEQRRSQGTRRKQ